jgi:hypothetical protein
VTKCPQQRREQGRKYRRTNPDRVRDYNRTYTAAHRAEIRERSRLNYTKGLAARPRVRENIEIIERAKDVNCADCGDWYPPVCMDFDHVRGVKVRGVGLMVSYSRDKILAEIAKCEVVCANCHRLRTYARLPRRKH